MSLRAWGILLSPERSRPLLPSYCLGFVDYGAGVDLGVSCQGAGQSEQPPHRAEKPASGTKPGLPCTLSHLPGRAQAAAQLFRSPRGAARLPGSLPRRLRLGAGNAGAFWWEPRTLRGREADAGGRSFFLPTPPSSPPRTRSSQPSAPNPIRSEPPSHRDRRR